MFAKINHIAIASDQYAVNARFYEALFGLKTAKNYRPARAVVVSDGYVGMNIIPRRDGRTSGLDHFGIEVEDIELAHERIKKFDPELDILERPPVRPYAAFSGHDPDTNIFDLSQQNLDMRKDVYAEEIELTPRHFSHFALRTRQAERCAQFYSEVFEFNLLNKGKDDPNYYLSDGHMTLAIMQWKLQDYLNGDPQRLGPDHIGFQVESIEALKEDLEDLTGQNPHLRSRAMGYGLEGKQRLELLQRCPMCKWQLTDIEGVHIDVAEH